MKFDMCVPILGFENVKEVTLEKIDDTLMIMKPTNEENISFALIDPFILRNYDFEAPDDIQKLLEITDKSNIIVLNIVLIQSPIEESLVNFAGPFIFNTDTNKAAQVILSHSPEYGVAEKISSFLNK
ncbi:flagellar assembly protein FliW [Sulfurimonas sp.]|uniref:flagellar assembly protein FliW n=1 Tax=Sulfurimonas sp. TaxID=2022749 RepID=UPI0025EA41EB|nr:flagellar assembly protein FliW [Sulfurimonas sp.]MDD5158071.1 flagellar assembly protein FliW [Sulfurimonas sp.]